MLNAMQSLFTPVGRRLLTTQFLPVGVSRIGGLLEPTATGAGALSIDARRVQ